MALISPILDDRTYEQLREELIKRIPVFAPEWTNHNESDPGIALLELFAYLGESLLYRFNQIPDATKIAFLRLLGVEPTSARSARTLLAVSTELPEGATVPKASEAKAGAESFETESNLQVWPLACVTAGKVKTPEEDADADRRADALHRQQVDPSQATFYVTTEVPTDPHAQAQPLDVSLTVDGALWIALLRKTTTDVSALQNRSVFVGLAFEAQPERPFALQDLDAQDAATFGSPNLTVDPPTMLWRLWTGPKEPAEPEPFTNLEVGSDSTRGLVETGVVEVILPDRLPVFDPLDMALGGKNSPPPLTDEKQAANVIAWLQVSRPRAAHINDAIHLVSWVGVNVVDVVHSRAAVTELLGRGDGDSDQRFALARRPVLPRTMTLEVEEPAGWELWDEVEAFTRSGPDDRHYTVDYTAGSVSFGGVRVPQPGERIRTLTYRYGGGLAGNVAAKEISSISGISGVKAENPFPAAGGADAASLADALDEIPAHVHRNDRAVISDDFRALALEVAGVARAETLPLLHPDAPDAVAAGVVSVVIFPKVDLTTPSAPLPDFALLRRVARYLDERRLVTTELYVIPPTYRRFALSVGIAVRPGYQVDAVRQWVDRILRQYLAPLPPFGPEGDGWPLGRTVRRAELEAVAVQVEGVEYVNNLLLAEPDEDDHFIPTDLVRLGRWEVPEIVDITVVSGEALEPGVDYAPRPSETVPVPLPPEVC